MARRPSSGPGGQRGFTLIESLLVAFIFLIVALGIAGLMQASRTGMDVAATQAFVQRTGTSVSEQMQREFTSAAALQVVSCGPQTTSGKAVMYLTQLGAPRCIYEWTDAGDPGPQLYRCALASWSPGATCTNTPENLLLILQPLNAPPGVARQIRAQNIFFQGVTCLPNSSGSCGDAGREVVSPLFDFRFDLDIPGSIDQPSDSFPGQRFAASFTTRN
jgi:prepilin-type N-terminal cleavage/methylation domain-containing protein